MSAGPRFPRAYAQQVALHLVTRLSLSQDSLQVVGSVRRLRPDVGDLEFIAAMPALGRGDWLYRLLAAHFYEEGTPAATPRQAVLFGSKPDAGDEAGPVERGERWGGALKGLKPGFKMASLSLRLLKPQERQLPVQIYRYDAGERGNRGWIEFIRTGPGDFGNACMARWQQFRTVEWGRPPNEEGSRDGYPLDQAGKPIPIPTEQAAFDLLRMTFIEPQFREVSRVRRYQGSTQ